MTSRPPTFPPIHYRRGASIHQMLEAAADRDGSHVSLRFDDECYTYRELDGLSNAMANELAARGVGPGTRVALMCSNRPEFVLAVFGTLKLGASIVMISPAWKETEIAHAIGLTAPALVLCDGDTDDRLTSIVAAEDVIHLDRDRVFEMLLQASGQRPELDLDWVVTEAVLVFSSGTTGMPKAVRHTHASLGAGTIHWASALGLTSDDRFQVATPPFHILGLLNLFVSVYAGSSVRLHRRFDLDAVLHYIEADRITLEMAVAPIALAMANHPDLESYDLSSLRYIMWGATPVTPSVAETVTARSGVPFLAAYGASEVPVITSNPVNRPDAWRLDSAGLPLNDVRLRIVDLETGEEQPSGQEGEIQISSPSAMAGYLPEEANAEAFADGWYRTGDVGWLEPEGWLHITDRVKEMIKIKGFQVAPAEIEAVLHGHPAVIDCAVFGAPDELAGEAVVAAVQLAAGINVDDGELEALVAESLASYKRITRLHLVDAVPRLASGKVLRRVLRDELEG
jgi:long-chain acyl-CoA synthetase